MKSRDIAIVGILLAVGAIFRYLLLMVPGPITSNMVIAFYCLAIILIIPTMTEAIGIGLIAGIISALISHSLFPPANLISEPVGAVVCLGVYLLIRSRSALSPGVTTFIATIASGFTFVAIALFAAFTFAPALMTKVKTVEAFLIVIIPIVIGTAIVNSIVVQILFKPASRVLIRG